MPIKKKRIRGGSVISKKRRPISPVPATPDTNVNRKIRGPEPERSLSDYPFLKVDPDRLEQEWEQQPGLAHFWMDKLGEAQELLSQCDEAVKRVRCTIILNITRDGIPDGTKITTNTIEAYYRTHPEHIEAKNAMIAAEREVSRMQALVSGIMHRKDTLRAITQMRTDRVNGT